MDQLISFDNGKTAAYLATQIPNTVISMKRGLKTNVGSVNRVRPR